MMIRWAFLVARDQLVDQPHLDVLGHPAQTHDRLSRHQLRISACAPERRWPKAEGWTAPNLARDSVASYPDYKSETGICKVLYLQDVIYCQEVIAMTKQKLCGDCSA
jgi:hypothetical protein